MYAEKVRRMLKDEKIDVGDRSVVEKNGRSYEGVLMPRIKSGDTNCIVLKLDNGYNLGIDYKGAKITKAKDLPFEPEGEDAGGLSFDGKKPQVSIITTGGTITSKVDYRTGGVTSLTKPDELHNHRDCFCNYIIIIGLYLQDT